MIQDIIQKLAVVLMVVNITKDLLSFYIIDGD